MKKEDKVIEAVPQRLDHATQGGSRTTATETLEVVHSPVQNITVVMDSEQPMPPSIDRFNLGDNAPVNGDREVPSTYCRRQRAGSVSDGKIVIVHQTPRSNNKLQGLLFSNGAMMTRITEVV